MSSTNQTLASTYKTPSPKITKTAKGLADLLFICSMIFGIVLVIYIISTLLDYLSFEEQLRRRLKRERDLRIGVKAGKWLYVRDRKPCDDDCDGRCLEEEKMTEEELVDVDLSNLRWGGQVMFWPWRMWDMITGRCTRRRAPLNDSFGFYMDDEERNA